MAKADRPASNSRPDIATLGGLLLALAGIVGGLLLEGGSLADIAQLTAGLIVVGGTFGAVMVSTPMATMLGSFRRLRTVFFEAQVERLAVVEEIIEYATRARKSGIVSLEQTADGIPDPFLRRALNLAVDGTDPQEIRKMMELEISMEEHRAEAESRVFESAGGYAPTIGIIGAVLGLIQVMKHLENIEEVGKGIAVAFVATVYGVGLANLILLPAANKIRARARQEVERWELILEGVISITEGMNPKLIRVKLMAFVGEQPARSKAAPQRGPEASRAEIPSVGG